MEVPRYTVKDYELWKEDWELIGGYPFSLLPSPALNHNHVIIQTIVQLGTQLMGKSGCDCNLFSETDWRIDEFTVLRPDLCIVCGPAGDKFIDKPPVWILEVLSPATSRRDQTVKMELYRQQGVLYYLLADPLRRRLSAYRLTAGKYETANTSHFQLSDSCTVEISAETLWKN